MRFPEFSRTGWLLAAAFCLWPLGAEAITVYSHQLPNNLFGNLDQDDVDACKDQQNNSFSCGAVAATNSFAFLQRRYPGVYGENLIPDANDNNQIDYDELKSVATEVS